MSLNWIATLWTDREIIVVLRSAKERYFRRAKGDYQQTRIYLEPVCVSSHSAKSLIQLGSASLLGANLVARILS